MSYSFLMDLPVFVIFLCRAGNTKSGDSAWMVKKILRLQKKNIR